MSVLLTAHQSTSHEFFHPPPSQRSSMSVEARLSQQATIKKRVPLFNRKLSTCRKPPEIIVIDDDSSTCGSPDSGTTWESSSDEVDKVETDRFSSDRLGDSSSTATMLKEKIKLEVELETLWCDYEEVQDHHGSNLVHRRLPCCTNSTLENCMGHYNLIETKEPYHGVSFQVPFGPEYVKQNYEKLVRSPEALDNTATLTSLNYTHMKAWGEAMTRVKSNYNKNSYISLKPLAYSYSADDETSSNQRNVIYSERIPDSPANDSLLDATNRSRSPEFLRPLPVSTLSNSQSRNKRKDFQSSRMYEFQAANKRMKSGLYKAKEQQPPKITPASSTTSGSPGKLKPPPLLPKPISIKTSQFEWLDGYFKK